MLEDTTRINFLYDFYGNLLTEKQRECLELYYQQNLSLAEIALESGISRQGVHDLIRRGVRTLEKAEHSMGLLARFMEQKLALRKLRALILRPDFTEEERREALSLLENLLD